MPGNKQKQKKQQQKPSQVSKQMKQRVAQAVNKAVASRTKAVMNWSGNDLRMAAPSQNTKLNITVTVDQGNFSSACVAFVIYGLTQGLEKSLAGQSYMALQVLLQQNMSNGPDVMKKAPRMWWAFMNATRPKTVKHKGQDYGLAWDLSSFAPSNSPVENGWILGDQFPSESATNGLYNINTANLLIPDPETAAAQAQLLWAVYAKAHPLMDYGTVQDYLFDPSAFAFKISLLPNSNDPLQSAYSSVFLEVPIRSFWGYIGLATGTMTGYDSGQGVSTTTRVPRFCKFTQGAAGHHIGLRLTYPVLRTTKFAQTTIDLKPVDLGKWFTQDLAMRLQINANLLNSSRPASIPNTFPPAYGTVGANLALLYRLSNYVGSMLNSAACWAGAWQNFSAIAVGTNNIDPFQYEALTESYASMAATRELRATYDSQRNCITIPFPTICQAFVTDFYWPIVVAGVVYPPDSGGIYGAANLDVLNSQVSGTVVSLVNGPSLKDDKSSVKIADGTYNNLVPNASAIPIDSEPRTKAVLTTQVLDVNANSAEAVRNNYRRLFSHFVKDKKIVDEMVNNHMKKRKVSAPMRKIEFPRIGQIEVRQKIFDEDVKVTDRTSPDTNDCTLIGVTNAVTFDEGRKIETSMQTPISGYVPYPFGSLIERLVHGDRSAFYPATNASQGIVLTDISTASSLVLDPTSNTKSDVTTAMLDLTNGSIDKQPNLGGIIKDVAQYLPPSARVAANAASGAIGMMENTFGRNVQKRRQAKGKKQLWRNLQ